MEATSPPGGGPDARKRELSVGSCAGTARLPHRRVVATALVVGITGDILVRAPQGPGLNVFLFFIVLALAIGTISRTRGHRTSAEAWSWILGGILLASAFSLRASPVLQTLAFLSASAAFAFPALRAGAAWMWRSGVSDQVEAVVAATGYAGFGALGVATDVLGFRGGDPEEAEEGRVHRASAVLRGALLAAPLLFVFGALFMSADRVFAGLVTDLVGTAVEDWASHFAVTSILAWLATGYFTGFLTGTRVRHRVPDRLRRPSIGIIETGVALGLVDLLFAVFVAVQFRYLFGGATLVEVTPGLTYAEYAREGFGQLALASALVLPTLLVSDWLLRPASRLHRAVFRVLGGLQLALLLVVIASAFQRVHAYQQAYGLTESRFYGAVFLFWLTLLGFWFGATVLRGRRDRFAFPALVSGLAVVAALFVTNPDAWIARTNLARSGLSAETPASDAAPGPASSIPEGDPAAGGDRPTVDAAYLGSLSADAVPTLLQALPALRLDARCPLARRLLERWDVEQDLDWRSWNRAVVGARDAVRTDAAELRRMIDADCPEG